MTTVSCEYPGYLGPWKSPAGDLTTVVKLLEMHTMAKHSSSPKYPCVSALLPENAKRPIISADITQEDWAYFMYRWDTYKRVTCMQEGSVVRELIKCCSKQVHKVYHRGFSSNRKVEVTEESALSKLEEISVISRVKKMPAQSELVS